MEKRPVVIVPVNALLLANMVRGDGNFHLHGDIPADAEYVGVTHDALSNTINLFFTHDSFPLCADGQMPTVRAVTLSTIE